MGARLQMEHRWGTRVTLNAAAQLRIASEAPVDVVIGNASLSGAYLQTNRRAPTLSCIQVRAVAGGPQWLEACVVRHDDEGMGVEWLNPALRQICALLALRQPPATRTSAPAAPRVPQLQPDSRKPPPQLR